MLRLPFPFINISRRRVLAGGMGKLIAKTAAITLACILAAGLLLFGIFSLFVPSVMVSVTDALGMEGACASYSVSVYKKSGKTEDLAPAVERSYLAEHYADAAEYGARLLAAEDFSDFCLAEDEKAGASSQYLRGTSLQYYSGITAVSQYFVSDERAIDTAFSAVKGEFAEVNAVVYLAAAGMERGDTEFCSLILDRLEEAKPSAGDLTHYNEFESALREFCS